MYQAVAKLHKNKTPAYDGLMSEHFQFASPRLSVLVCIILQAFLKHGFLPDGFMIIMIVPILKNKNFDVTAKKNYRLIAIPTVMSKILEVCLCSQEIIRLSMDNW